MKRHKDKPKSAIHMLSTGDLRAWQHPTIAKAVEALEIFSVEPGDGRLAASIILASEQLAKQLKGNNRANAQAQALLRVRDQTFAWLVSEINSSSYDPDPSRATNQIDKALNCALLLYCMQSTAANSSEPVTDKARTYIAYVANRGWPHNDLLPFVVSCLEKPRDIAENARQYLLGRVEHWRAQADIQGMSFALIRLQADLDEFKRQELIATLKVQSNGGSLDISSKAWALLALTKTHEATQLDADQLAEALLDDLSRERLIGNQITPTVTLLNQFPFSTPEEIGHRVEILKQRKYAPAQRISEVTEQGVLINLFSTQDDTWSFALDATNVAFATFALIQSNYSGIVGAPLHYSLQIEEAVRQQAELRAQKSMLIPTSYVKLYNTFAIVVTLQIAALLGVVIAIATNGDWTRNALAGVALAAIVCIVSLSTQRFVIVGMGSWLKKRIEDLIGAMGKK